MKKDYKTKDIYLTSFLLINDYKIIKTSQHSGSVFFHFYNSPDLNNLTTKFFSRNCSVEPNSFIYALRGLKNLINETLNQIGNDKQ